jgi:starvation-inducible DNA-binding protein
MSEKKEQKEYAMARKSQAETLTREETELNAQNLAQVLANTYVTYVKTQNFHWNLTDPRFHDLHKFFEALYQELAEAADELAERIRMLKLPAPGSMRQFLQLATLEESEERISGDKMLLELYRDREEIIAQIDQKIEEAGRTGDMGTQDLFIQQLRMHQKSAWMLQSHLSRADS